MKKIKHIILTLGIVAGFGLIALPTTASAASALNLFPACDQGSADSAICKSVPTENIYTYIKIIINTLLFVLGAVSVVTIIIAGIRYTTSQGEAKSVQAAKDTLLYAVIGLVVAIGAYSIVNFVIGAFFK